jgi:electron transport complex protein RnfB
MFILELMTAGSFLPDLAGVMATVSVTGIGIATAVVSGTGLLIGLFLGVASKKLEIKVDEKEAEVRALLPSSNCGGCGYPGCDGLAKAIANGEAPVNACVVANQEIYDQIAKVMGKKAEVSEKMAAFVKCAGTCDKAKVKYDYYGVKDCRDAASVPGRGAKACAYGCLGYGSCVKVCAFDAIHIVDGVAVVDRQKCTSCGKCVEQCPNKLIELVPVKAVYRVACSSNAKGKDVKMTCSAGCIGCMLCVKNCESSAIAVDNNLAKIDYEKCTNCGKCAAVCPMKVIRKKQDD